MRDLEIEKKYPAKDLEPGDSRGNFTADEFNKIVAGVEESELQGVAKGLVDTAKDELLQQLEGKEDAGAAKLLVDEIKEEISLQLLGKEEAGAAKLLVDEAKEELLQQLQNKEDAGTAAHLIEELSDGGKFLPEDFFINGVINQKYSDLLPLNSTYVAMGDSLFSATIAVPSAIRASYQNRGLLVYANIKSGNKLFLPIGGGKGIAGQTTTDMVARLGSALALKPAIAFILGGTNNLVVSANTVQGIINDIRKLYSGFLSVRSKVILFTIFPRYGESALSAENEAKRLAVNEWIRLQASPDVIIIDSEAILVDTSFYYDGLHLNSIGAAVIGGLVASKLNRMLRPGKVIDVLAPDNTYNQNLYFTGTTGAKTNGTTGIVATSYELDRFTTGATVEGAIDILDGIAVQSIKISGTYSGVNPAISLKNNTTVSPPITGDVIEALAEFKIVTNDPNIIGFNVTFDVYNASFGSLGRGDSLITLDQLPNTHEVDKLYTIRTPAVVIGAGTPTRVGMEFKVLLKDQSVATAINASVIVYRVGARKVPSSF